ncbi:MAG: hypothetical protein ACYC27_22390 [Armatimonadota bacterium]
MINYTYCAGQCVLKITQLYFSCAVRDGWTFHSYVETDAYYVNIL